MKLGRGGHLILLTNSTLPRLASLAAASLAAASLAALH